MRRIWDFSDIRLDIPMLLRARAPLPLVLLVLTALGGCDDRAPKAVKPALVRTEIVRLRDRGSSATLTGDIEARIETNLSFRVSGRVVVRLVDVGAHVNAGDVLARLDPKQQQADLDAATANLAAAELQLQVA
jgi:multidrug efflux pump subunit AcrA (membrane-fusion protein)